MRNVCLIALMLLPMYLTAEPVIPESTVSTQTVEQRTLFLQQELITAQRNTTIFNPGHPPRVVWRDYETVRDLDCTEPLRVRWFDADLNEETTPTRPGRWCVWVDGVAPNGTPVRRSLSFFCRPPGFFSFPLPDFAQPMDVFSSPTLSADAKAATRKELETLLHKGASDGLNNGEYVAAIASALCDDRLNTASVVRIRALDDAFQLSVKLKALGLSDKVRPLPAPRVTTDAPAPVLRAGTSAQAGMKPGTMEKLDAICREWAQDGGEPFATLVARNGVVVLHGAYGRDKNGTTITTEFRTDVASITKSIAGLLFARFVDEKLLRADDPISVAFPDFPTSGPLAQHVPTFRQLLMHTSGLTGHSEFGAMHNPNFENFILNKLDVIEPGRKYEYSGNGFTLLGKALENLTGQTAETLINTGLCEPLGIGAMPMDDFGVGAQPTAWQLGTFAQVLANRGRYGDKVLMNEETFADYLPEPYQKRMPWEKEPEWYGYGIGRKTDLKPGVQAKPTHSPEDYVFGTADVLGHGSISFSILRADYAHNLIVVQVRRAAGERFMEWANRFFTTVAEGME